jgi:hypothetical protein
MLLKDSRRTLQELNQSSKDGAAVLTPAAFVRLAANRIQLFPSGSVDNPVAEHGTLDQCVAGELGLLIGKREG